MTDLIDYSIEDTPYGAWIKWSDTVYSGAALDSFAGRRQVLVYDESDSNQPAIIVRYSQDNKVSEIQVFTDCTVLDRTDCSHWLTERDEVE